MSLENLFEKYHECHDRFTFDNLFRKLLLFGYTHEEAKDLILCNCALSAIIFQERLENELYMNIQIDKTISDDLQIIKNEIFNSLMQEKNLN
ncbi:MAG: hypothetical protein FD181_1929 [Prolixibacteraceae bacterium]|nr:MAG: hypothetical protein FD181_1929 [Prolixibacteraceae bacterium]